MYIKEFSVREFKKKRDGFFEITKSKNTEILEIISNQGLVIVKDFFSKQKILDLRCSAFSFSKKVKSKNPKIEIGKTPDYWRFDNNPDKSKVKRLSKSYRLFFWNKDSVEGLLPVMSTLSDFRNQLAGLDKGFAESKIQKSHISIPVIMHYPAGGGYLEAHQDPESFQKLIIMIKLSKKGLDYHKGGFFIKEGNEINENIDDYLDIGDMYIINPSCIHGIKPIDPELPLNLNENTGRWSMWCSLVKYQSLI